jgi:hypothetical protein
MGQMPNGNGSSSVQEIADRAGERETDSSEGGSAIFCQAQMSDLKVRPPKREIQA